MLEIQNYLRSGGTLERLTSELFVKTTYSSIFPELVSLNYDQILSPNDNLIVQECRGLILDTSSWEVVSKSFNRFFNFGQPGASEIDWATAIAQEKVDGSLISFYYYHHAWRVATKGNPDASGPVGNHNLTFSDLVHLAMEDMGTSWSEFTSLLNPDIFYCFELTAPENRVIVPYLDRKLTWLAAWDKSTFCELDILSLPDLPAARVRTHAISECSASVLISLAGSMTVLEDEGLVVKDADNKRIKIKSPSYLMATHAVNQLSTPKRRLELVLSNNFDDIFRLVPDFAQVEILSLKNKLIALAQETQVTFETLKHFTVRKDFAAVAYKISYFGLLFQMYDGKTIEEAIAQTRVGALLKLMGFKEDDDHASV